MPESPNEKSSEEDGGFYSNPNVSGKVELFIPAPPQLGREAAHKFHLTTRNFFAWMYEKPVVGDHLGDTLALLHDRLDEWRHTAEQNSEDIWDYFEAQGYLDFRDCPDHAMAIMHYAGKYRDTELWTDAFAHCVGMYDTLNTSLEFSVSRSDLNLGKALIRYRLLPARQEL